MASPSRATICDLPDEVLLTIFSHLPVADLARCAATCERWRWIVTGFALLWNGKTYTSYGNPAECAETRAVLHALPPLRKVVIEWAFGFMMDISYPRIELSLKYVFEDCPRLRCKFLSTRVDVAGYILSNQTMIDLERLRHLQLMRTRATGFSRPYEYSSDYVVRIALNLCPSLRHLSVFTDSALEGNLDAVEGLSQLNSLEMSYRGLQKLSFLRHCSEALEDLQLVKCPSLPSRELTELRQLRGLRRLRLRDCVFQEGDLVVAVTGLVNLERLQLECCSSVSDPSFLQHCGRLAEVQITNSYLEDPLLMVMPEVPELRLADLRPPKDKDYRVVRVVGITVTAVDLPTALTQLEKLGLASGCLAYLGTLRNCSQLRNLVCEFVFRRQDTGFHNVRIHISLTSSAQS